MTTKTTKYDARIQWTDESRPVGYQETREDIVVEAADKEQAVAIATAMRPKVSSVLLDGVNGIAIAFRP
jgi:hypothetical protein